MTAARDVRLRLVDMVEHLRLAREFCAGVSSAKELGEDAMRRLAVIQALEIVGEAARHVPETVRAMEPQVPWAHIAGLRNRLAHGYFESDIAIVWHSATSEGPSAEPLIRALLARLDAAAPGNAPSPES